MSFPSAHSSAQDAPLVGRELELDALCAGLRHTLRGKPNLALVCGEAGIGKTRLLREFAALARRLDVRVIHGCASEDSPVSYLPFMGVFEACSNAGSGAPQASDAATLFEALRGSAPQGGSLSADAVDAGEHERLRLFLTITRQVLALARREPTLLVLDDLHWADAPSLTLLAQLGFAAADAAEVERLPLMIVALHRPVEVGHRLGHVLQRLRREPIITSLELEGLPAADTSTLLRQLAVAPVSSQLVDTVQRITHGYPLFVQELVHQLRANDLLERVDGYVTVKAPPVGVTLPHDVRSAVAARLAALDDAALRVLELAALLGDTFSLEPLARVAGLEHEPVLALLEAAVEQQLLVPEATAFRFRHPLLRQALAERPSATRQELMHLRIARALQAAGQDLKIDHISGTPRACATSVA